MSSRSIVSRLAALGLAAGLLPSCGGTSGSARSDESTQEGPLKISHFRVNPDPKTKRPDPTYRVLLSESWRQMLGEAPREPFPKAAPKKVFKGFADDAIVARYIRQLRDLGLDRLKPSNPDDYNPVELFQRAMNPQESEYTRIFTVGSDKSARSYYYRDQQTSEELIKIFYKCELLVSRIMDGYTMLIQIESPRVVPDK